MKLVDHSIIGAMVAPRGKAAFDRGSVVLVSRLDPDQCVQVRAYVGADAVQGDVFELADWQSLVRAEQAIPIPPVEAASGVAFWVLRPVFEGREAAVAELRVSGALVHDVVRMTDGSFGCLVHEPRVIDLRDRWADAASAEAVAWARSARWEHARVAASRAFVLERAMSPDRIAMLSLAHERCGSTVRAGGYVEMARRSRGDDFARHVLEKRADLERHVGEEPSTT